MSSINRVEIEGIVINEVVVGEGYATFLVQTMKTVRKDEGSELQPMYIQIFAYGDLVQKVMRLTNGISVIISGSLEQMDCMNGGVVTKVTSIRAYSVRAVQKLDMEENDRNQIVISGRLGTDVSISNDGKRTSFNLASGKTIKNGDNFLEETTFFKCVSFGSTAERIKKNLNKGTFVTILGRLDMSQYTDKNGQVQNGVSIVVDKFDYTRVYARKEQQLTVTPQVLLPNQVMPAGFVQ